MTQPTERRRPMGERMTHETVTMADSLYLLPGFANAGAIVTRAGVAIVDTGNMNVPDAVLGRLRQITQQPIRYIIYTHAHADHAANATPILQEAEQRGDPRPQIIGHINTLARMNRYGEMYGHNAFINRVQFQVPPDRPSFPSNDRFIRPAVTYTHDLTLQLGELTLALHHAMGETDDITWIHIPERKAIFSGDLVIGSCPNIGNPLKVQRYEVEWANALEQMRALRPEVLGPGHGVVLRGAELEETLRVTAQALRYLHDEVVRRMNIGQWEEQIVNEVQLPSELANHPALAPVYGQPSFIVHAIYRRYGGWYDGNPSHLAPSRTGDIAAEVVRLASAEALLQRAEALQQIDQHQLALHLIDLVIDDAYDVSVTARALRMKSASLKARAEAETSFIARSILTVSAEHIAREVEQSASSR
jgi:alkyl sulfatase BDS1-like metallo-beta-lactamase superfamily hydrolase